MLGVNILQEFDALCLLEASVDNGSQENDVLWLTVVFADLSLNDIICADANITYNMVSMLAKAYLAAANALPAKSCSLQVIIPFQFTTTFQMNTNSCLKTYIGGTCRNHPNLFTL